MGRKSPARPSVIQTTPLLPSTARRPCIDWKDTQDSEPGKKAVIKHLYVKDATTHVSSELLNGKTVSVPIPDVHLQGIGRKSDGVTAGEVTQQTLGSVVQQVSTAMTSVAVHTATKSIQKAVDSAAQTSKNLFT